MQLDAYICHLVLHHKTNTPVTDFVTGDYYFYTKLSALYHHLRKQLISHKHNMTLECIMLTICIHVYVAILHEGSPHNGKTSV